MKAKDWTYNTTTGKYDKYLIKYEIETEDVWSDPMDDINVPYITEPEDSIIRVKPPSRGELFLTKVFNYIIKKEI